MFLLQHFPFLFDAFVHHILLVRCNSMTYPAAPYLWFFISLLSPISASQSGNYSILDLNIQSHQLHRATAAQPNIQSHQLHRANSAQPNITSELNITHTYLKFPSTHTIISKSDLKLPLCPNVIYNMGNLQQARKFTLPNQAGREQEH